MAREDFKIFKFVKDDVTYYGFNVEYWGFYYSTSYKRLLDKREKVKQQVKEKLEWIEIENQKYYARLAEEERQRAILLKEAKK